jgi:Retinoblastoma-associated protein A domain
MIIAQLVTLSMKAQGIALYYKVLDALLGKELERSGDSFHELVVCASFHKCLAACSFEVVSASYRMVRLTFNKHCCQLLNVVRLSACMHDCLAACLFGLLFAMYRIVRLVSPSIEGSSISCPRLVPHLLYSVMYVPTDHSHGKIGASVMGQMRFQDCFSCQSATKQ